MKYHLQNFEKTKNPQLIDKQFVRDLGGGERGIRTPGTSQFNSFQDYRNRPLCHLSLRTAKI